ncbi:MAG: hypothetical protein KAT56_08070, partial [Sedimentisphaerales bacterium]|nr:hypothetical protein [Sedimentisphaerales bacterium]
CGNLFVAGELLAVVECDGLYDLAFEQTQDFGGEFQVNTSTADDQKAPNIAIDGNGDFVIVWEGNDADKEGVFAQHYDSDGSTLADEFQVNFSMVGDQKNAVVATDSNGDFVVAWEGVDADKKGVNL